jgi:hypothetical protein
LAGLHFPHRLNLILATGSARTMAADTSCRPPLSREFCRYLECRILAHGFARARCGGCRHDLPAAFSYQGMGVCPSCTSRRMVATAAHLTDHVLPPLPACQWVLAVPKRLRRDADRQGAALRVFLRVVGRPAWLRRHRHNRGPRAGLGPAPRPLRQGRSRGVRRRRG